jgi:hypothetical protein
MSRHLLAAAALAVVAAATPALAADAPAAAAAAKFNTADSSIGTLLDNPETKAVLEKHIPQFVSNPQIEMAKAMTLKQIQGYAGDALSDDALAKIDADLAKIK